MITQKADTIGHAAGVVTYILAGMSIMDIIPWVAALVGAVLMADVQIYAIKAKKAERAAHDADAELKREQLRRLTSSDEAS